jgi:hypothetical protein
VLIGGAVALFLGAEFLFSIVLLRVNRTERRISVELEAAQRLRRRDGGPHTVLLIGNSLLLDGVDVPSLTHTLESSGIDLHRFIVEQTAYLDWYYGLRKLFAEGSRPEMVVLELNPTQLISEQTRGDYAARRLFQASDILAVAHDAGYSPTETSSLVFAHYSAFYGMRTEVRKWFLRQVIPLFETLQPHLAAGRSHTTIEQILTVAPGRIEAMRNLCSAYGVRFVLLAPAVLGGGASTAAFSKAARTVSVDLLVPLAPNEAPQTEFADGFHMTPVGAMRYTSALAPLLKRAVLQGTNAIGGEQ